MQLVVSILTTVAVVVATMALVNRVPFLRNLAGTDAAA